jgi:predicted  nucleic acid-binding Zn-ribbon protein
LSKFEKNVELAEVKVDLALLDDIKKIESTVSTEAKKAYDEAKKVDDLHKKVNASNKAILNKLEKIRQDLFNQISDAKDQAKNLGIELPREFTDRYQAIVDFINKVPVSNLGNVFPI